jgi:transcriptional regulator PpsR
MDTTTPNAAQPDITLLLDSEGVIREVHLAKTLASETADALVGRPWAETVTDSGGDKVRRLVEEARTSRVSVFRQINQRFPSGLEVLMEFTTVRLGGKSGVLAIGRSLQAVADLQSRLIAAQQALERDYWKLREIETRYRMLFDVSGEAVLLVRADTLEIVEANPAALRALGHGLDATRLAGRSLADQAVPEERERLLAALRRAREHGKAPGVVVHFGAERIPHVFRASLLKADADLLFLVYLGVPGAAADAPDHRNLDIDELVERSPEGFVVVDAQGIVRRANRAFLDLVQVATQSAVVGQSLSRWLRRPGADLTVLIGNVERHGMVRLFATSILSDFGTETEVEISASGDAEGHARHVALFIRDVGRRIADGPSERLGSVLGNFAGKIGKTPLRELVRDTVEAVERHYVEAALELTAGNRTAAAQLLGLTRQSLYAKLDRYEFGADTGRNETPDR